MAGCLDGVRVLELARYQAGPRCGMLLSDLGAEVLKIEKPGGEDTRRMLPLVRGQSIYFSVYNRGKKSICLDLRTKAAKEVFFDLLKSSDIVIENFRPGTLSAMGLGYEELVKVKPDIILVQVSGYGQGGSQRDRAAFDSQGQAASGLMMLTGKAVGKPVAAAFSVIDRTTALNATVGTLAALRHRDKTGRGQIVDVCLMDAAFGTVEIPTSYYLETGSEDGEQGRPPYRARDGWVTIAPGERLRQVLELIGSDEDPHTPTMFGRSVTALQEWCAHRTRAEVCARMLEIGVAVAAVQTVAEAARDPHLQERQLLVRMEDPIAGELPLPGLSIKLSDAPGKLGPVPMPGQHTQEILSGLLGYDSEKISRLRAEQAIG